MERDIAVVLAEVEHEFTTEQVIAIGDDYFYRRMNGGSGGAWQKGSPQAIDKAESISRREARARMLEMGLTPDEVADKTKGVE